MHGFFVFLNIGFICFRTYVHFSSRSLFQFKNTVFVFCYNCFYIANIHISEQSIIYNYITIQVLPLSSPCRLSFLSARNYLRFLDVVFRETLNICAIVSVVTLGDNRTLFNISIIFYFPMNILSLWYTKKSRLGWCSIGMIIRLPLIQPKWWSKYSCDLYSYRTDDRHIV